MSPQNHQTPTGGDEPGFATQLVPDDLSGAARDLHRKVHQTIARVTRDIEERLQMNTAVAAMMELVNEIYRLEAEVAKEPAGDVLREALETVVLLLAPFTPHVSEEMWARLGHSEGVVDWAWPEADANAAREEVVDMAVQVNGKVRGHVQVPPETPEADVRRLALEDPKVVAYLAGKEVVKVVVIPGRLVSVVAR